MNWTSTAVIQKESHWAVQAASTAGESAELECASEAQARYFAAVLSMGPAKLPKALIMKRLGELNRDEG